MMLGFIVFELELSFVPMYVSYWRSNGRRRIHASISKPQKAFDEYVFCGNGTLSAEVVLNRNHTIYEVAG